MQVARWVVLVGVLLAGCNDGQNRFDFDGDGAEDMLDCEPEDATIFPEADDPYGDGVDTNCDGADGIDADGDGFAANAPAESGEQDCNDAEPLVQPGVVDTPGDGLDNDCDGVQDDDGDGSPDDSDCDPTDPSLNTLDVDSDGQTSCEGDCDDLDSTRERRDLDQDGSSTCDGDCDDSNGDVLPEATEVCDGLDTDCDGELPPDEADLDGDGASVCEGDCDDTLATANLIDADGDGVTACDGDCDDEDDGVGATDADGDGVTACAGDCDDEVAASLPGAIELCDGQDNDCDGALPDDEQDLDGDGASACGGDCDDEDPGDNLLDSDGDGVSSCAGDCDDADATLTPTDSDADGVSSCAGDCNDEEPAIFPGATELCDGLDGDCDGVLPSDERDADGDGSSSCAGDCSDGDAALHPNDNDGDGVSPCDGDCDDADAAVTPGDADGDGVDACAGDCDDTDATVAPGAPELCDGLDQDCDGAVPLDELDLDGDGGLACADDCDDQDASVSANDGDGDGLSGCDGDCDDNDASALPVDIDGDGVDACSGDCAPSDPTVFPGASEVCNGVDDDCDGVIPVVERDEDGDGASACAGDCDDADPEANLLDEDGDGASPCAGDCDDDDPAATGADLDGDGVSSCDGDCAPNDAGRYPGAPETCDGIDEDCDGVVPQGELDADGDGDSPCSGDCDDGTAALSLADLDGDGATSCGDDCDDTDATLTPFDLDGDGLAPCDGDCDDTNATVAPAAVEACDGVDTSCAGSVAADELDLDGDGFFPCEGDCQDGDAAIGPFDGDGDGDSPCDGDCDDSDPALNAADLDLDGFDTCSGDCDGTNGAVFPGAAELCNGTDDDCDGALPTDELDADADGDTPCAGDCDDADPALSGLDGDSDGVSSCGGDCDDTDPVRFPLNAEIACDGVDSDCLFDAAEQDTDGDGTAPCAGDCAEGDPAVHPGAVEVCDGQDGDCDGAVPPEEFDTDADGYVECAPLVGPSSLLGGGDCDDGRADVFPGATETCDFADQSCDGVVDEGFDLDGDGVSSCGGDCDDGDPAISPWLWDRFGDGIDTDCDGDDTTALGDEQILLPAQAGLDQTQWSIAAANVGDVDGDGVADVLLGAPNASTGGLQAGVVYLYSGAALAVGGFMDPASALAEWVGEASGDHAGTTVAGLGDLDGDGLGDFIIGAPGANFSGTDSGRVYVLLGASLHGPGGFEGGAYPLAGADVIVTGASAGDELGIFLYSGDDHDGDGINDGWVLSKSATSFGLRAYRLYGSDLLAGVDFALPGHPTLAIDNLVGRLAIGDFDGDDLQDLVFAYWSSSITFESTSYNLGEKPFMVQRGATLPLTGTVDASGADALLYRANPSSAWGTNVRVLGDVDGDGRDDLVFYSLGDDAPGISSSGRARFVSSSVLLDGGGAWVGGAHSFPDVQIGELAGISNFEYLGERTVVADVDGDGAPELLLSANGRSDVRVYETDALGSVTYSDATVVLVGDNPVQDLYATQALGDLNGDGREEVFLQRGTFGVPFVGAGILFGEATP